MLFAQFEEYLQEDPEPTNEGHAGMAFSVVESGTGIGGYYLFPLQHFFNIGATMNVFFLRDSKQFEVYYPYSYNYGYPVTVNKENNVYLIDLLFTVKKRFFAHELDNNFRPFAALSFGPIYGMNFPEAEEISDQYRWALSGALAIGVDAIVSGGYMFGFRLQYRTMKFNDRLGERTDHSMFDVRLELGKLL